MPRNEAGNRKAPVKSKGRGDPVLEQSLVVVTASVQSDACNRSTFHGEIVAPFSDKPEVHSVVRGEWVMGRVNDLALRGTRPTTSGLSALSCFSNVNGLKKDDKVMAIGIVDFPSNGNGSSEMEDNDAATIRVAGTCTGINTGGQTILFGQSVYLSEVPYHWTDEDGQKCPGVDCSGLSVPREKFYPATIPMNSSNVTTQINWLRQKILPLTEYSASMNIEAISPKVDEILRDSYIKPSMPLWTYAHFMAINNLIIELYATPIAHPLHESLQSYCKTVYDKYMLQQYNEQAKFARSLGDEQLPSVYVPMTPKATMGEFLKAYAPKIASILCTLQGQHQDYLESHYLGMALSNSPPGAPLDVLLKAGRG
jgi:hypothetical protein